ncbi:hypothetical protein NKR19_g5404 [Coniochaeta hoffmannii]|uniref:Uncharacterized protein n=1 Tax=Coniochaeta hoffmannii TaxID=91930 RepID=A0AA38VGJ0_9PEZI|nr:hypothetical protein NKR19_g5404 [Coniochaeta hoffmannii]
MPVIVQYHPELALTNGPRRQYLLLYAQHLRRPNPACQQALRQFEWKFSHECCLAPDPARSWEDAFISRTTIEYDKATEIHGWGDNESFMTLSISSDELVWFAKQDGVLHAIEENFEIKNGLLEH